MSDDRTRIKIDHDKLIDGFGQLARFVRYRTFETSCSVCDASVVLSPLDQKHLLEERKIPVKMLMRGAVRCPACRARRERIKALLRVGGRSGHAEARSLTEEENALSAASSHKYRHAPWPYDRAD